MTAEVGKDYKLYQGTKSSFRGLQGEERAAEVVED